MSENVFFLSHSSTDKIVVRRFANLIKKWGQAVWLDEINLRYGEVLLPEIQSGIRDSTHFIFFGSKKSLESEYVREEIHYARQKSSATNFKIFVVMLEDNLSPPLWLQQYLYLNLFGEDLAHRLQKFLKDALDKDFDDPFIHTFIRDLGNYENEDFFRGWTFADEQHATFKNQIRNLLMNSNVADLKMVADQILELRSMEKRTDVNSPIWSIIEPGLFEAIFPVPMRVPPAVKIEKYPENSTVELVAKSNIAVLFRILDASTGQPLAAEALSQFIVTFSAEL